MSKNPSVTKNNTLLKIGDAAKILGVSIDTLRRWEKAGKIKAQRTPGGTRLYSLSALKRINPDAVVTEEIEVETTSTEELLKKASESTSDILTHQPADFFSSDLSESDTSIHRPSDTLKKSFVTRFLIGSAVFSFITLLLTAWITASYLTSPKETAQFFKNNIASGVFKPFHILAEETITVIDPKKAKELGFVPPDESPPLIAAKNSNKNSSVLAVTSTSPFLEVNADTQINGSLFVRDSINGLSLEATPSAGTIAFKAGSTTLTVTNNATLDQDVSTTASPSFSSIQLSADTNQITKGSLNFTLPSTSGTLITKDSTDTLKNKSMSGADNTFTAIPNSALSNSKVTVTAGTNLSGGGDAELGSSVTLALKSSVAITTVTTSGIVSLADGTAAAPSLTFTNDLNSGLYSLAADKIGLITGGTATQGITIDASGNVGIATIAPSQKLEVVGTAKVTTLNATSAIQLNGVDIITGGTLTNIAYLDQANIFTANQNFSAGFDVDDAFVVADGGALTTSQTSTFNGALYFGTSTGILTSTGNIGIGNTNPAGALDINHKFTVTSSGLVGIGTTNPTQELYINSSDDYDPLQIYRSATGNLMTRIVKYPNDSGGMIFYKAGNIFVNLNNGSDQSYFNGNVGIGNTNPGSMLSLSDNATIGFGGVGSIAGPSNGLGISGNLGVGTTSPNNKLQVIGAGVFGANYGQYSAASNGLLVEGNVGIGATTSSNKLDVWGNSRIAGTLTVDSTLTASSGLIGYSGVTAPTNGLAISGNLGIGTTSATTPLFLTNNATTTTIASFMGDSITTGKLFDLSVDALTTGTGLNLTSTSTAFSSGYLTNLDWSPTTSTTATGSLLNIGIGVSGMGANYLNLTDAGSSIFSISKESLTTSLPVAFNSPGDVSIAYDLNFTNPTTSNIKSQSPLTITAGEVFNSSDLTLQTYNFGNLILAPNSGNLWADGTNVGIGTTNPQTKLYVNGNAMIGYSTGAPSSLSNGLAVSGNVGIGTSGPSYKFQVNTGSSTTFINSSGNVGIGATTSSNKLDVWGNARIAGTLTLDSNFSLSGGQFLANNGTASLPAYSFTGDTDTGLWSIGTNIVGLTTNGAGALQSGTTINGISVNANGNVGIGTTNSSKALYVVGTGSFSGAVDVAFIKDTADGNYILDPANTGTALAIAGNAGIGTTSPNSLLSVAGGAHIGGIYQGISAPSNGLFVDGNVGIGATTSSNKLDVWGNARIAGNLTVDGTTTYGGGLTISGNILPSLNDTYDLGSDSYRWQDIYLGPGSIHLGTSTADEYVMTYDTTNNRLGFNANGSGPAEIVMDSNGNIGIGTTNPGAKLYVSGASGNQVVINSTADTASTINFANNGTSKWEIYNNGGGDEELMFYSYGAEGNIMTMQQAGNIGIGLAASSPTAQLDVQSTNTSTGRLFYAGSSAGQFVILDNGNVGVGTTAPKSISHIKIGSDNGSFTTDPVVGAGLIIESNPDGADATPAYINFWAKDQAVDGESTYGAGRIFSGYISGAAYNDAEITFQTHANNTSAWTSDMTIKAGKVGVGTTSPNSTLSVAGGAHIGGTYQGISAPTNGLFVDGNVGIGATTSSNKLDVWGNARIAGTGTFDSTLTALNGLIGYSGVTAPTSGLAVSGNVGIGFTSPSQQLQVGSGAQVLSFDSTLGSLGIGTVTPGVIVSDTFTRADSATTLGSADTGQSWTAYDGTTWGISSNQAYKVSGGNNDPVAAIDSGISDGVVQVTVSTLPGNGHSLIFRAEPLTVAQSNAQSYWSLRADDGRWILSKVVNTYTFTDYGTYNGAASGDVLKVVMQGSVIKAYVNGSLFATANDAFNQGATKHGFRAAYNSSAGRYDNFTVSKLNNLYVSGSGDINIDTAATVGLTIKGASSQTANLTEWKNSSRSILSVVDANGNLGIGTSVPWAKLSVQGNVGIGYTGANQAIPANGLAVSGNVGIGTTTANYNLSVAGTTNITGNLSFGSQSLAANGSASLPAYSFTNLTNAGLWTNGDGLLLTTGGTNTSGITVTGAGNVGIGWTSPGAKLVANGRTLLGTNPTAAIAQTGSGLDIVMGSGTVAFQVWDDNALTKPKFIVERGGNVGIGTSAPSSTFEILSGQFKTRSTDGRFVQTGSTGWGLTAQTNDDSIQSQMILTNTQISAVDNGSSLLLNLGYGGSSSIAGTAVAGGKIISASEQAWSSASSTQDAYMSFQNSLNGALVEYMRINSAGNVGIGTSSPNSMFSVAGGAHIGGTYQGISAPTNGLFVDGNVGIGATTSNNKLDVWGNARIAGNLTVDGTTTYGGDLTISGNLLPSIDDTYDLGSNTARWKDLYLGPDTLHIGTSTSDEYTLAYDTTNNRLGFNVNGSGPAEIVMDSSGNLGIGTSNPSAQTQIVAAADSSVVLRLSRPASTGSSTAGYTQIEFTDPSSSYLSKIEGGRSTAFSDNGYLAFRTRNGVLGSDAERLRIDGDGNIGIGTATTIAQLDVRNTNTSTGLHTYIGSSAGQFAILDNGNVGIGTTGPGGIFEVSKSVDGIAQLGRFLNPSTNAAAVSEIYIGKTVADNDTLVMGYNQNSNYGYMQLYGDSAGSSLVIADGGNVGIGMSAPRAQLDIMGASSGNLILSEDSRGGRIVGAGDGAGNGLLGFDTTTTNSFTRKMTIKSSGNVGVGTEDPRRVFEAYSTTQNNQITMGGTNVIGIRWQSTDVNTNERNWDIVNNQDSQGALSFRVGTTQTGAPSSTKLLLASNGDMTVYGSGTTCAIGTGTGATNCTSDARLKTNVSTLDSSVLDDVMQLNPVNFRWLDPNKPQTTNLGFIAQEVQEIFPEVVHMNADGYWGMDYAALTVPAIKAIQIQQGLINALQTTQATDSAKLSKVTITDSGNVGIGTTDPGSYALYVNGSGFLNDTAWTYASDSRLKENVTSIGTGLDVINALNPVTFDYTNGGQNRSGFIAQEVQQVLPDLVSQRADGMLTLRTDEILPYAVEAIQQLNDKINKLQIDADGTLIVEKLKAGTITLDPSIQLAQSTSGESGPTPEVSMDNTEVSVMTKLTSLEERIQQLEAITAAAVAGEATSSAALAEATSSALLADSTAEATSSSDISDTLDLTDPSVLIATSSASLAINQPTLTVSEATVSGTLTAYDLNIQNGLKALGKTTLADTTVAGTLTVDGTLSVENGSEINVIGALYLQKSILADSLDILDGAFTFDKDGTLTVNGTVLAEQFSVKAGTTAGTGTITAGQIDVIVENEYTEENSVILITPHRALSQAIAVTTKVKGGFLVELAQPETQNISFDYLIVGVK